MTEWFDFPGYEEFYQVTKEGVVRSKSRLVNSPAAGGQRRIKGKIISLQNVRGYLAVSHKSEGKQRSLYVHQAVAKLFVSNPENKPCVNHIDGNKKNNDPSNLEWCTHKENMRHAFCTGLTPYPKTGPGEDSPSAKLNNESVAQIKKALLKGVSRKQLAQKYGVAQGTIGFIASGQTWRHINAAS